MTTKTKTIIGAVILGAAAATIGGEVIKNSTGVILNGKNLTDKEYANKRDDLSKKVKVMKSKPLSIDDYDEWTAILDKEIKKCNGVNFLNIKSEDIINKANDIVKNGC